MTAMMNARWALPVRHSEAAQRQWAVYTRSPTRWLSLYTQSGMASVGGVKAKGADLQNRRRAIGPRRRISYPTGPAPARTWWEARRRSVLRAIDPLRRATRARSRLPVLLIAG